jgi:hypothetical protein
MSGKMYIARSKGIAARMLGDEMMIMSGRDSTLFTLNDTAAILWRAADGVTPLDEIVEKQICAEFDVAPEEALRDAETLAQELAEHGILAVAAEPIVQTASAAANAPVNGRPNAPAEETK